MEKDTKDARIFDAVTEDEKSRLSEIADEYKVNLPTLIRWWVVEVTSGQWSPAHLQKK